jgi:carbamoyl-phosphate synthase large subunit
MQHAETLAPATVLVTGAGGPAAIAVLRAFSCEPSVTLVAADMDRWASGLYLVDAPNRVLVPAGGAPEFADELFQICVERGVDILVPTVDVELQVLAREASRFEAQGINMLLPSAEALDIALDKLSLARACRDVVRVPRTELVCTTDAASWAYPVIVKPRRGSGSRGVALVCTPEELEAHRHVEGMLVQENLPGQEYSVDVLADSRGRVVASVPRVRQRVDSGVSVGGYTLDDHELERFARTVVETVGLAYVSNVQIRRDADGRPALLEVNPRVPGSLALTVAAGVDMARLAVDSMRGAALPEHIAHREVAMVRFLADLAVEIDQLVDAPVALAAARG